MKFPSTSSGIIFFANLMLFFSINTSYGQNVDTTPNQSSYSLLYSYATQDEFIPYPEDEYPLHFNIDPSIEFDDTYVYDEVYDTTQPSIQNICSAASPETSHCTLCKTARKNTISPTTSCCTPINIEVHGGVYPIIWVGTDNLPKFSALFATPWIVGGHIGYNFNRCRIETYVEGNYVRARAKGFCFDIATQDEQCCPSTTTLQLNHKNYSLYSGYFGGRYRSPFLCNRFAFFAGAKVGFIHHNKIDCRPGICLPCLPCNSHVPLFLKNTVISGGAHIGINACITSCISLLLTAEVIASMGVDNNPCIAIDPCFCPLDRRLLIGNIRSEIAFPVTIGLQFEF